MATKKTGKTQAQAVVDLSKVSPGALDQVATIQAQISGQADIQKAQDKHRARLECVRMASDIIRENNRNKMASSDTLEVTPETVIEFADKLVQYING